MDIEFNDDNFVIGIPITKVDAEKRTIEGFATLDNIDKANEILDFNATKAAFAAWPGNIREMHQKKAVGKAIEFNEKNLTKDGETYNGMWLRARISKGAEDTWQKVLDGTLAGFSVGGAVYEFEREMQKDAEGNNRPIRRVTRYGLSEISLVDSPCNTLARVDLIKSLDGSLEIQDVVDDGSLEKQDAVDEDQSYITAVIDSLQTWRDSEVQDGDDSDIIFISRLIQELKCRLRCGDTSYSEDSNTPGMGEDMENSIDRAVDGLLKAIKPPKKPYGNVIYADPGYQSDKKDRYPIDTEEHVKAAWSYINQADNASAYSPENLASIKAKISTAAKKFGIEITTKKDGDEILHNNEISDISNVENLSDENKSVLRKFVDFLIGEKSEESDKIEKGSDSSDMNEQETTQAITEAVTTVTEDLNKSVDEKFDQVGDSLTKVAEALEKLATKDAMDELKTELIASVEEKVSEVASRVETLENSGSIKKSNEDTEGEKLEKKDEGFWSDSIVPAFLKEQVKAGR